MFHHIELKRTADTAVLKSHETVIFLVNNAAFLNESSIDIYFANVVYDYSEFDAFFVC